MENTVTANEFRGRAIGGVFFTGFGALWIGLSLYVRESLGVTSLAMLGAGTAVLLLSCLWLYRQGRHFPTVVEDPAVGRAFKRINIAQWVAVAVVSFSFARLHLDAYAVSATTAIVGIHLLPLAKLFRRPLHTVTGLLMVLWASATVLIVPVEHLQGTTAAGTGMILWISAAVSLVSGVLSARNAAAVPMNADAGKFTHAA